MNVGGTPTVGLVIPIGNGSRVAPAPAAGESGGHSRPDTATISIQAKRTLDLEKLTTALLMALMAGPKKDKELQEELAIDAVLLAALGEACCAVEISISDGVTTFSLSGMAGVTEALAGGAVLGMLDGGFAAMFTGGGFV